MTMIEIFFTLNDQRQTYRGPAGRSLLDILREDYGLTGAKDSCGGEGECGACTVILDGQPVNACLVLASQLEGSRVTTIEGLAPAGQLHPIEDAFIRAGAIQCGFCTPGMVLASKALLDQNPHPSEAEIRSALAGNLCRCTGYVKIVQAVKMAAGEFENEK
jgi:aerobic-type carbon monoxide dehydrogenase small subunit (CoxS/CutS family)